MAHYDNEIYRGPPEQVPTLSKERHPRASDIYMVKAPAATAAHDQNATRHHPRPPVSKKKRLNKIEEAMQFLVSCVAAVTVVANISAATPVQPDYDMPEWPGFAQIDESINGHAIHNISQHGDMVQVSTGAQDYRITAKQDNLHLFWMATYSTRYDASFEGFGLMMENLGENWRTNISFYIHPHDQLWYGDTLTSQFTTSSGEVLYVYTGILEEEEFEEDGSLTEYAKQQQHILDHLSDYIEITEATEDGWGKVLIGHTMYSDTNSQWNGMLNTPAVSPSFDFTRMNFRKYADYTEDTLLRTMKINDIEWSFYYSFGEYSPMLWAVPAQEDIALGSYLDYLVEDMGLTVEEMASGSPEINAVLMDKLNIAVQLAAENCFSNYHLYRANGNPTTYFPDEMEGSGGPMVPTDPIEPTGPMPTDPGMIHFDYFDANIEFTIEGRHFIMFNWRDDILLRQHYTGEDHVQIDMASTDGQFRVNLIVSLNPNGAEYIGYPLENGTELYTGVFNHWGDPWIYDEDTLFDVNCNLSDYVRIIETSAQEEVTEPTEPDPYDYLPEYTQYIVDSSGMTYSPYARSNRVCYFSTNGGKYRLESQSPDLFMLWENYHYDMKEESANSYITFNHIADSWSMGVWVFDEPVDSVYDSFTLTAGDGTTLWFYIANFDDYTQQNNLDAILMKLPDILFLSRAKDGNWTKVLYGNSLIVDVTSSWSGLAYTANNDDFWSFDQMISVNDLQNHNLRFADSRTVNGTTWKFYTTGGSNGYGMTAGKEFYSTQVFAVPTGGDICFVTSLYNGLSVDQYEFSSQAEYEAYIDANVHLPIDTIVSQGLINFHSYQSQDNVPNDPSDPADFDTDEEFYPDKYAYDWIGEYSSYDSTPDGILTHTCYGWSNRTCQLNVNNNAYRLEAMTPEMFICWDDYSYDTESQSGTSQIRIYHLREAWNLITWVSDNPEHLASADFSLTMEDGTQLWFYVLHHYAPADPLQDIIQRIENYVKLSPPREDGWNKVRIGKTMISDMNMHWNGRNSTARTGWCIREILSREAAAEDAPQFIETRTVNGITWNFYHSGPGKVYAVPQQEDIWLSILSGSVLNIDLRQFRNGQELSDYYNANIGIAIDRIINEGLSNFYPYSE